MKADLTLGGVTLRPEERALYTLRSAAYHAAHLRKEQIQHFVAHPHR